MTRVHRDALLLLCGAALGAWLALTASAAWGGGGGADGAPEWTRARDALEDLVVAACPRALSARALFVIPGGGPGDAERDGGLPRWTRARADAALEEYAQLGGDGGDDGADDARGGVLFVALSAGSMNAPSARDARDGSALFESRAIFDYLVARGAPADAIVVDWLSWGNARRVARRRG